MTTTGLQSACPQCGAPLHFGGGHSIVNVCGHCRSTIMRTGSNVESLGLMPDLVATDTRLAVGFTGKIDEIGFTIVGRVQLNQGQAAWDEWYASWSDGVDGWIAEARGRLLVFRRIERELRVPAFEHLEAGSSFKLQGIGRAHIEEVGEARITSAQGELPFQPRVDATYRFVDASLRDGGFVTLDYGSSGGNAEVFVGRDRSYAESGVQGLGSEREFRAPQTKGDALDCPNCGAPLSFKSSDNESIVCESCRALCHLDAGKLALVRTLKQRGSPQLLLGARGTLDSCDLEVIGWVQRAVGPRESPHTWNEYLLHGNVGYRWLSEANGHWTFFQPVQSSSVDVLWLDRRVEHRKHEYLHFEGSEAARYRDIQGEFYWQIDIGERATLDDFVCPPFMLSRETIKREVNWTFGRYIPADELWQRFGQTGHPPPSIGVGPCQPNPFLARSRSLPIPAVFALVTLIVMTIAFAASSRTKVFEADIATSRAQPVYISEPFEIRRSTGAAKVSAQVMPSEGTFWLGLDIALINDSQGESSSTQLELSHFSGIEDGEVWVEDHAKASDVLGSIEPGRYLLRVERFDDPAASLPSSVRVRVEHGAFLWFPLWIALGLLLVPWLYLAIRGRRFEFARWCNSDHPNLGRDED